MPEIYELVQRPDLDGPVLIVTLEGWVDAGLGAAAALAALLGSVPSEVVANFDEICDGVRPGADRIGNGILRSETPTLHPLGHVVRR